MDNTSENNREQVSSLINLPKPSPFLLLKCLRKDEIKAEMPSLSKIKITFMFHLLFLAKE